MRSQLQPLNSKYCTLAVVVLVLAVFISSTLAGTNFEHNVGKTCSLTAPRIACGDELVCNTKTLVCEYCTNSTQCMSVSSQYQCKDVTAFVNGKAQQRGICTHKELFPNVSVFDGLSALAVFIGGTLSGAGGIGGGGIFVPLLNLIGQFPPDLAVPLSKATILGGAVCNVLILSFERHPHAERPLIDYDTAVMLEPATLLGTIIGVYFNVIFPSWLTVMLLIAVLGNASINLFQKTIAAMRKETGWFKKSDDNDLNQGLLKNEKKKDDKKKASENETQAEEPILEAATIPYDEPVMEPEKPLVPTSPVDEETGDEKPLLPEQRILLEQIIEEEKSAPVLKLLILVACWFIVFSLSLLKGGHGAPSIANIQPCSFSYWFIGILSFPLITAISIVIGLQLMKRHREKESVGYHFKEGDVHWSPYNTIYFPLLCAFAGTMAALLGIGGGMIKGPVLLDLGLDPHVASATSSLMILFTASITSSQYLFLGRLPLDYGLMFCSIGFLSSLLGQIIIGYPARKYKLTFVIILSIAVATVVATALMGGLGIYNTVVDIREGVYMGFNSLC